jgi:hypothetical protein
MALQRFTTIAAVVIPVAVFAQSDRIPIRPAPAPNQTAHGTMTLDMQMELTIDGAPPNVPLPPGPTKLVMQSTFGHTLAIGPRDEAGNITAHITFDELAGTVSMNGMSIPTPQSASLKGKEATVVYDATGTVTSISMPDNTVPDAVKQMVSSMLQSLPVGTVAVGESVTVPLAMSLPLPVGGNGLNVTGSTKMTLMSVANEGGQRVAHYASESTGRVTADGNAPMGISGASGTSDTQFTLKGTMDVNLDHGLTQAVDQHGTFELDFQMGGSSAMHIHMAGPIGMTQRVTF